jgi:secreted trypsin-like serine protease
MKFLALATAIFIVVSTEAGHSRSKQGLQEASNFKDTFRVVGGDVVTPNSLPFQAFLVMSNRDGRATICGGSLITPRTVLTAAHCIVIAKTVEVILGAHNRAIVEPCQQRQNVPSTNLRIHPGYTPSTPDDDIGLLILEKPAKINKCVKTVDLPTRFASDTFAGESGVISGWGKITDEPDSISDLLRSVTRPIITNKICGMRYGAIISNRRICTDGSDGKGSCLGDSGGPLTVLRNNRPTVIGIASFVLAKGCTLGYPSGFTRVTSFLDWIAKNAKN